MYLQVLRWQAAVVMANASGLAAACTAGTYHQRNSRQHMNKSRLLDSSCKSCKASSRKRHKKQCKDKHPSVFIGYMTQG